MAFKNKTRTWGAKGLKSRSTKTSHTSGSKTLGSNSSSYKSGTNGTRTTIGQKSTLRKNGTIKNSTTVTETWRDPNGFIHRKSRTTSTKNTKSKSPKPPKIKSYSSSSTTSTRRRKSSSGGFGALLSALFAPIPSSKKTNKVVVEQTPIIDTPSELTVLQQRYNELSQKLMTSQTSEDISFLYDLTFKTPHDDNIDLLKAQIAKMERHLGKTPEVVVDTKDNVVPLFNKTEEVKDEPKTVKTEPEKKPSLILGLILWAGIIYGLWSLFSYIF